MSTERVNSPLADAVQDPVIINKEFHLPNKDQTAVRPNLDHADFKLCTSAFLLLCELYV